MSIEEQALQVILTRLVSRERAKEHILGLWRALCIDAEEPIKAALLLNCCTRFDLEDDPDIAELRRQSQAMVGHLATPEDELEALRKHETENAAALPDEAYSLDSMPARIRWIGAYLAETRPTSVLDFACGYGHTSAQLLYYLALSGASMPSRWVAAGLDTPVLHSGQEFCARANLPIEFAPCSRWNLADAPDGPFDVVLLLETLEHVAKPAVILREVRRRGRRVVVSVPGADTLDGRAARAACLDKPRHHVRQFTPRSLASLLGIAESEVTTVSSIPNDIGVTYAAVIDGLV